MEGEFYVMGKKYPQKELVLGRQLAEIALCLQKSQAVQEDCQQEGNIEGGNAKQEPKMTRTTNPNKDGLTEPDKNRKMHKEKQAILVNEKSQEEKTSTTTNKMQEPAKDPVG